jgi:hypothetical protein
MLGECAKFDGVAGFAPTTEEEILVRLSTFSGLLPDGFRARAAEIGRP